MQCPVQPAAQLLMAQMLVNLMDLQNSRIKATLHAALQAITDHERLALNC